ncbi:MAG TPA: tRNA pseudouridine(38-40) synthase TruA [Firmicutes bacterium]|nr:tRNA pseudouridine(38-40) synthase TruA [Bacillota bacterium]
MQRLLLTLRYDGTAYHGWQAQPNGVTVQQTLQDAVQAVTGVRSGITGCSRTDAGVHAEMFCCTLETASPLRGQKLCAALNAHLPRDIAVYGCREVGPDFHPRYDARGKRYLYRIWNEPQRNPFWEGRALHYRRPLDVERLDRAAKDYLGSHDFAPFCAAGSSVEDTVRTVRACGLSRQGGLVVFAVEADGFLYNMVRIMVGTLLEMAAGRRPYDDIPAVFAAGDRAAAGMTAPAHGLILDRVFYGPEPAAGPGE